MTTPTFSDRDAAGARYLAAVIELRAAWGDLAAIDRILNVQSFGDPPAVVPLRHPRYADLIVHGSFADDVLAAMATYGR